MDATVVPGYTRLGYAVRRRGFDALPRMDGRTVLVTGATSGLGRAAADGFARLGARILVLARDSSRGTRAVGEIVRATANTDVHLVVGDLSDLASLDTAAADVAGRVDALDVLVHNAGALQAQRTLSPDGIELTFATNVVGPFALTALLTDLLRAAPPRASCRSPPAACTRRRSTSTTCRPSAIRTRAPPSTRGRSARRSC